eukprot:UN23921
MTFQRKITKNPKFTKQQCRKQLLVKCKGNICTNTVFFLLIRLFKINFQRKLFQPEIKMLRLMLILGMNSPRKSCWKA